MEGISLSERLTCITTLCIAIICGCLTMLSESCVHYMILCRDAGRVTVG